MKCPLKFAIYWARRGVWTLIDASEAGLGGLRRVIDMPLAMRVNEVAALGDRSIGVKPPLRLKLYSDTTKPRTVGPEGDTPFTIARASLLCGDAEIIEPLEQKIAWILVQFGEWGSENPEAHITEGKLDTIEFVWE